MKVALTGAGGFIGRATVAALLESSCEVEMHVGPSDADLWRPAGIASAAFFDITDYQAVRDFIAGNDVVVHIAGPPSVVSSFQEPLEYVRAHVLGTATVLDAMRHVNVHSIIYMSSAEVYGSTDGTPVDETRDPVPRSPYGASKAAAEHLVRAAGLYQNLGGYVIRPFSVYGPGMRSNSFVALVLDQAIRGSEVFVNDLSPVRDFCFVGDLAQLILAAVFAPRRDIVTLNASFGRGYSIAQAICAIGAGVGRDIICKERGPKRPASTEIHKLIANVDAAKRELGWQGKHDLEAGIREMLSRAAMS